MEIKDIQKLAKLSRIEVSENEQKELLKDMESILGYVEQISEVATEEKTPDAGEHRNIMREDKDAHDSSKYTDAILDEAPRKKDDFIEVKQIL